MKKYSIFATLLTAVVLASCTSTARKPKKPSTSSSEVPTSSTSVEPTPTSSSTTVIPTSSSTSDVPITPILEKIILNKDSLNFNLNPSTLYVSEVLTISFEGKGEYSKDVLWSSNNEKVATVANGLVTGVAVGNAVITVKSAAYENISATCNVTVINDQPTVTGVSVDPSSTFIDLKTESEKQFTATVNGTNNPSQSVTWKVNKTGATVSSTGLVTATAVGTYTITATSVYDATKSGSATLTVSDTTATVTGVTVSPTSATVDIYSGSSTGATKQLTAKVNGTNNPSQEVTWSSSDTTKATVSASGLVTGKATGSVTITATSVANPSKSGKCTITVKDTTPVVTSITLQSSITVHMNKTGSLTATVNGSNLTDKEKGVNWSINDTSVATISNGTITPKKIGNAVITATSTYNTSVSAQCNLTVDEASAKDSYTILMYISGSNLEGDYGYATKNINAILSAGKIPDGVNFVIQTGGSTSWSNSTYGSKNYLHRLHVEGSSIVQDAKITRTEMCASSTLQSFLEYGLTNFDAEQIGLIMWNHGGGISGVCCDDNASDEYDMLNTSEVYSAVKGAFSKVGRSASDKLTWIGYDACLMGVADIATVNADYFEYMIGSQETEAGEGWNYKSWVSTLYNNPNISPVSLLSSIGSTFVSQFGTGTDNDQTLATYDLSKANALVSAFNQYVSDMNASSNWSSIKSAYSNSGCLKFGASYGSYCYGVADFVSFLTKLKSQSAFSSLDQTAVTTAITNMVVNNNYGKYYSSTKPCGVCAFVPCDSSSQIYKADYTGTNNTRFTNWQTACLSNGSYYSGGW